MSKRRSAKGLLSRKSLGGLGESNKDLAAVRVSAE